MSSVALPSTDTLAVWALSHPCNVTEAACAGLDITWHKGHRDAKQLQLAQAEVWAFDYGVWVIWGHSGAIQPLLEQLLGQLDSNLHLVDKEHFEFSLHAGEATQIRNDQLVVGQFDTLDRLAVSHAFAQSGALGRFESTAKKVIQDNRYLSEKLADSGRIPLNRKDLAKLRGLLFQTKSDILLHFNLLDTPEFFWDYPELDGHYQPIARYLELLPRTELLSRKLETIHELVDMLASEQNHQHSSFLEWIIIILIAVEIVLFFVHG